MNILLIDKRVRAYETIVAAIDPALAVGIVFDYFEDTFETLKARMRALGITTGNSVGLIQHNYRVPMFSMLASAEVAPVSSIAARDPELARWSQFRDFIAWCKSEFSAAHFDMMACALYSNKDWKYVIDTLTVQTGVTVHASTDNTGSAALGGDWFLESHTGVNLKTVYFTETIEEYRGVLYLETNNIREYSTKGVATGSVVTWGGFAGTTPENVSSDVVAVYSAGGDFAALKTDGSVVAWGDDPGITGGVVAIYSTNNAFAALKTDGSVQAWGNSDNGGSAPNSVTEADSGVVAVYSAGLAFAALKTDGSVVTWGNSEYGGTNPGDVSSGVVAVYSTFGAFAALKTDGSVVTWGDSFYGGDSSSVSTSLVSGVVAVYSTFGAFAALKTDGSVVAWGDSSNGGDSSSVSTSLVSGVVAVYSATQAFAALKTDGSVVAWGDSSNGGDSSSVSTSLVSGVVAVYSATQAFAALKSDGSVVTWGYSSVGGDSSEVSTSLVSGVVAIYSTGNAFAALKTDGSVVVWGESSNGGNSSEVSTSLVSGVVAVYSTGSAFAALKSDGSVVAWGSSTYGGDASSVGGDVVAVYSTQYAFAALKTTATTFNLSAAHYRDMDRYDILRKKENRRRVNLTTLNNNVFTLSQARDIQSFNPTIPAGKTFTIIVPDYTASSYSITSTATVPNSAGSFIIACDEGEHVTISGTTYVNYGSYVYKRETDNTYTKTTSVTINSTLYTLYGGDGINSSGIALISSSGGGGGSGGDSGGDSITDKLNNIKIYGSGMYDVLSGLFVLK
jgi:alpha-tubulin suppressor-like RCC1 family protein